MAELECAGTMSKELTEYMERLRKRTNTFEENICGQQNFADFLKSGAGTINKVLGSAQLYVKLMGKHGNSLKDTGNLVPVLNLLAIVPVILTGITYLAMAWDMLECDKGTFEAAQSSMEHCLGRLKKRFDVIEKSVDELGAMVGVMKVLHHEGANRELDQLIILFDEKLRLIKSDVDECNRQLELAKATIDEEIEKLNYRVPIAATVAGVLGVAGLGVAGAILSPFVVGVPMIAAASAGSVALFGSGTVAAVAAVKYKKIRNKFFVHLQQQELLCEDLTRVTERVSNHTKALQERGIKVETPWMIALNWSLILIYKCISQLPEPTGGP